MSVFGWSLPPGCHSLPHDETGAIDLKFEGLPELVGVFWTEDDEILIVSQVGRMNETLLGKYAFEWSNQLDDAQNIAAATHFAANELRKLLT